LGFTSTYILFHWVGYELTTLRIETSSLINQPVEIRRAINVSARVTGADVSENFEDQDGVLLDDDKEEEVVVEVPPAAAEVEVAEAVPTPHSAHCCKEVACCHIIVCLAVLPGLHFPDLIIKGQRLFEKAESTTTLPLLLLKQIAACHTTCNLWQSHCHAMNQEHSQH